MKTIQMAFRAYSQETSKAGAGKHIRLLRWLEFSHSVVSLSSLKNLVQNWLTRCVCHKVLNIWKVSALSPVRKHTLRFNSSLSSFPFFSLLSVLETLEHAHSTAFTQWKCFTIFECAFFADLSDVVLRVTFLFLVSTLPSYLLHLIYVLTVHLDDEVLTANLTVLTRPPLWNWTNSSRMSWRAGNIPPSGRLAS